MNPRTGKRTSSRSERANAAAASVDESRREVAPPKFPARTMEAEAAPLMRSRRREGRRPPHATRSVGEVIGGGGGGGDDDGDGGGGC